MFFEAAALANDMGRLIDQSGGGARLVFRDRTGAWCNVAVAHSAELSMILGRSSVRDVPLRFTPSGKPLIIWAKATPARMDGPEHKHRGAHEFDEYIKGISEQREARILAVLG